MNHNKMFYLCFQYGFKITVDDYIVINNVSYQDSVQNKIIRPKENLIHFTE